MFCESDTVLRGKGGVLIGFLFLIGFFFYTVKHYQNESKILQGETLPNLIEDLQGQTLPKLIENLQRKTLPNFSDTSAGKMFNYIQDFFSMHFWLYFTI